VKKTLSIILVVLFTISCFLYTNVHSNVYAQEKLTPIMGQSQAIKEQAFQLLKNNNSTKTDTYIQDFVDITWEEAAVEGVRADVAFSLMMLETGWLKFGGRVLESQNNFGGIGATDDGGTPASFPDIRTGIRAVVQHLKAYASTESLKLTCVDPRFELVKRGCAEFVEWLGIQENPEGRGWASGKDYGPRIINIMNNVKRITAITNLSVTYNNQAVNYYYANNTYIIRASAVSANNPLYEFSIGDLDNGTWMAIQNYSSSNATTWTPAKSGKYEVKVQVKDSASSEQYDTSRCCNIIVETPLTTIESFSVDMTEVYTGKPFTATVKATSPNKPLFKFWIGEQTSNGNLAWTLIQDYSEKNTVTYTVNKPGNYRLSAYVKDSASTNPVVVSKLCDITAKLPFTVVLDAGHGGNTGARSSKETGSLIEDVLNLDLTLILGNILQSNGINVIYTRTTRDSNPSLQNRVDIANENGADLFISVHHNAFKEPIPENKNDNDRAKGVETLYSTSELYKGKKAVEKSGLLAEMLANNISINHNLTNRGPKIRNDLPVIRNTTMPSVLIEVGFMTNDEEVLRLADPKMQQSIAQTIADKVMDFFNQLDRPTITNVNRIAGGNRYETAAKVSQAGWPKAHTVILARDDDYADALAGVPLAYQLNAPILLTQTKSTVPATMAEITRLGAQRVILMGGSGAISDNVMVELKRHGLAVERIDGKDRYETASRIAECMVRDGADFDTAFIAVGTDFADALAASCYAAMRGQPILLTNTNNLPQATKNAIANLGIKNTVVCGGPAAVSDSVFAQLPNPKRVYGKDRYLTALEMAKEFMPGSTKHVYVSTGLNFPDAIDGGVLAAKNDSCVLLIQGNHKVPIPQIQDFMANRAISGATIFGGPTIVSSGLEEWFKSNLK
jgi:N-acetylmuramoyl-L-alanine amidase/putative cell wall-binding protein